RFVTMDEQSMVICFSIRPYVLLGGEDDLRNPKLKKVLVYTLCAVLMLRTMKQLIGLRASKAGGDGDPERLLYEVSLFQLELLHRNAEEAAKATSVEQLNELKQAIHITYFTHERLVQAAGSSQLTPLESLNVLMQSVMNLQMRSHSKLEQAE